MPNLLVSVNLPAINIFFTGHKTVLLYKCISKKNIPPWPDLFSGVFSL